MAKALRPYQQAAIDALFSYFAEKTGNPLVVAPVGAGKSLMIAEFIRRACTEYPGTRVMVLSHVSELLTQTAEELFEQWPLANASFYAAKLGMKKLDGQVIFATIQSIFRHAFKLTSPVDLVVVDEAHLISAKQDTAYQKLFADLRIVNPALKIIGFTGTPFRATEGTLIEGDGRIFTDIAYQIPMLFLIEKGHLCPPVTPRMKTQMSVEGIRVQNGDYVESQLQAAIDKDEITRACVDEIVQYGQDRKKWIVFTAGVEHCEHVRDEIRQRGISCEMVTGKTPTPERNALLDRYKSGDLRCLVNVAVLTTGFNNPAIDLLAFMRPTRSPVLYIQCCGRAIRTAPGKTDALILDFGGVVDRLGPLDTLDVKKAAKGTGDAPVKVCPECHAVCFAGVRKCQDCGNEFPFEDPFKKLVKQATVAPMLSTQVEPEWVPVLGMMLRKHQKSEDKPPVLRVTYITPGQKVDEWVCFEHQGYAREKAVKWHQQRYRESTPETIDEALELGYPQPIRIQIVPEGKWWRVVGCDYKLPETAGAAPASAPSDDPFHIDEWDIPF